MKQLYNEKDLEYWLNDWLEHDTIKDTPLSKFLNAEIRRNVIEVLEKVRPECGYYGFKGCDCKACQTKAKIDKLISEYKE